jgi:peptidoglycan/LPS O-acetylase OafA/YrhL
MTPPITVAGGRRLGLDVLRAFAILAVLVSHYGIYFTAWYGVALPFQLAAAGFFGVELFFVLSGFLIGRLLITSLDQGVSARAWLIFMVRRWMRTLPLYVVCLLILLFGHIPQSPGLPRDWPWFFTMTQNFAWPMVDNAFSVSWSLTVEEWFYVLFSGLLFAIAALAGTRVALCGTLLVFLAVPTWLRWHLPPSVDWAEVTSKVVIYRLDAIGFGVLCAWMFARHARPMHYPRLLFAVGLLIIALFWGGVLDHLLHPPAQLRRTFIFDVASVGFVLWMPAAAALEWRVPRLLAGAARLLSNQSYAMYLTHLTIIECVNIWRVHAHIPTPLAILVTLTALFAVSTLSYHALERPILAHRPFYKTKPQ